MNKKLFLLFFVIISLFFLGCKNLSNISIEERKDIIYRIESISSNEGAFIIEAVRGDSVYKILTENNSLSDIIPSKLNREKILIGESYHLLLRRYFPDTDNVIYGHVDFIEFNGSKIRVRHGDVFYIATNLKGLYFEKDK